MEAALHPIIGGVRLASLALRRVLSCLFASPRLWSVKRTDAEAIAGAALRPTMRYVSVKSAAQQAQAAGIVFRTRNLFVRQRCAVGKCLAGPSGRIRRRSSHREGFSSDVSWSILTRLRQTCQNQTCQNQTCQRRFRDCAGSELCRFMNCAACTLSRYPFLMKRSGVSIKRYNTGQRQTRAHRVS